MDRHLEAMPEDWQRMLAVVAHPDHPVDDGRAVVGYVIVIVTDGDAGIDGLPPGEAGPIRVAEQEHSAKVVGVDDVRFLHYADGVVEPTMALRRDLAREIRRARREVLLTATYDLTYGLGPGSESRTRLSIVRSASPPWTPRESRPFGPPARCRALLQATARLA